jgi:hypothetical protein
MTKSKGCCSSNRSRRGERSERVARSGRIREDSIGVRARSRTPDRRRQRAARAQGPRSGDCRVGRVRTAWNRTKEASGPFRGGVVGDGNTVIKSGQRTATGAAHGIDQPPDAQPIVGTSIAGRPDCFLSVRNATHVPHTRASTCEWIARTGGATGVSRCSARSRAGATVSIGTTTRSDKRAYLFHWCWKIGLGKAKASEATAMPGVDIEWDHGDEQRARRARRR